MSSQELKGRSCKKNVVMCMNCNMIFHPSCAEQAGYSKDDGIVCCRQEDDAVARMSASSLSSSDIESIVTQLSDVLQVQFDKFKREMRNEYFEQIATLTGKGTELSLQHEVYVRDIAEMKMAVDSLRRENIDLRAKIYNNVGGCDIESFCAEANDRVSRCRNFMLLDVEESVSVTLDERIEFDRKKVNNNFRELGVEEEYAKVLKVLLKGA
ncbi:hypothetical protein HHI36_017002 [Cryptolaemus montrouzieri]|uniref:Zinc finger PHD-type domain-containing protein n=1 Tax=Cryptolaemus montrouzieri TaxID=559131 RepID=A0ABD2NM31_9CUCU